MITLEVAGTEYDNFLSAECSRSMLEFNSEASFTIALEKGEFPPFLGNEACTVLIDGNKVMTGFIDIVDLSYDRSSHIVNYTIRDKSADFADSSIDVINDLSGSLSLKKIIESIISHLGLDLKVINKVEGLKNFNSSTDNIIPEVGENCFDYVEKLARKRQVLITTNADGDIEIIRNSGAEYKTPVQNSFNNLDDNNILSAEYTYDLTRSYRKYIVKSQLGSAASGGTLSFGSTSNTQIANQKGEYNDLGVRKGRQKVIIAGESASGLDNAENAKWQASFERTKSTLYAIKFLGHSIIGELLEPNKLMAVLDDFATLDEKMLVESVHSTFDVETGSISRIVFTDREAFTLKISDPNQKEQTSNTQNNFKALSL